MGKPAFNIPKRDALVHHLPCCSICGLVAKNDHPHCERFDAQQSVERHRFSQILYASGMSKNERRTYQQAYDATRTTAQMMKLLRHLRHMLETDTLHSCVAELDGVILAFQIYCT
ncbi:hypothetical protein GF380_04985 [Candidatus Uhrbacteria bacterium]|nr:hypothetical protein [Candidatus Uhrbacteria bacterium]MBD3284386.1 hypothetical protein [Candidatus Uhrbacteria bacterium]